MNDEPVILATNRRTYHGPGWEPVSIMVVLVAGEIGDYAAYISAGNSPDWTARHGDKLSFAEAQCHFPVGLEEKNYRL